MYLRKRNINSGNPHLYSPPNTWAASLQAAPTCDALRAKVFAGDLGLSNKQTCVPYEDWPTTSTDGTQGPPFAAGEGPLTAVVKFDCSLSPHRR